MSYYETNKALCELFNLPNMTQRAVIVLRHNGPPIVRVTRLLIEKDAVSKVTERFELRKIEAERPA